MCSCFHFRPARVRNLALLLRPSSRSMPLFSKNIGVPIPSTIKYWVKVFGVKQVKSLIWPPKLAFREVGGPIWPPKSYPRPGQHPNLTPKITLPGRSIPQFDPQNYILDQVDTLICPPKLYPRPGRCPNLTPQIISSTRSRVKNRGHFSFYGIQRSNLVPQIWESRRVRVKNEAHFSCSGDQGRKPIRKCVAVYHSEERSRPHFDTSKSKIILLEMTPHPSLHSATKNYVQEDDFLLVAKPSCTQKGTPFLLAL